METKYLKLASTVGLVALAMTLSACDPKITFQQMEVSSKLENPVDPGSPVDPNDPDTPVSANGLVINNQDIFTKLADVTVTLDATNVTDMYVTENPDCSSGGKWEVFNKTKAFTLTKLNQKAFVYAKFKNGDYETGCVSDDITHDNQAPAIVFTSTPPASSPNTTASYSFTVTDGLSQVGTVVCSLDHSTAVACDKTATYTNLLDGVHSFKIVATDVAGNSSEATHQFEVKQNIHNQVITIGSGTGKADVLFVVNNSTSMFSELRGPVSSRFKNFANQLKGTDFKIAVTSADSTGVRPFEAGKFSFVMRTAVPGAGIAVLPKTQTITPATENAAKLLETTLMRPEAICVQVGTHMCPNPASNYQEAVHSSLLAVTRAENKDFFRTDASLHLVIISDDDEGAGNLTDRKGNILPTAPEYNRPEHLVKTVKSLWPNKEFKAHAMIRKKGASCNAFDINATEAHIYQKLVEQTGGQFADICKEFDKAQVEKIASAISTQAPVYTLTCDPVDANKDGKVDASDLMISYVPAATPVPAVRLEGRRIHFDPQPAAGTEVRLSYICP